MKKSGKPVREGRAGGGTRWERLREELTPRRDLMLLKVVLGLNMFALFSSLPYMSVHMRQLGVTYSEMATILALQPLGVVLGPPLSGLVADKTGHYKLMLCLNSVATAALTVAMLYVPPRPPAPAAPSPILSFVNLTCHTEEHALTWSVSSACPDNGTPLQFHLQNCEPSELLATPEDYFMCFTAAAAGAGGENITDDPVKCINFEYPPFKVEMSGTVVSGGGNNNNNNNNNNNTLVMSEVNYQGHGYQRLSCGPIPLLCQWYVSNTFGCSLSHHHHNTGTTTTTQHQQHPMGNSSHLQHPRITSYADFFDTTSSTTFWAYLLVRLLWNMFCACTFAMMDATTLAILKKRGGDYGKQRVLSSLAATIAPVIAGVLVDWYSRVHPGQPEYTPALYLSGASFLASAILATRLTFTVDRVEMRVVKALRQLLGSVEVDAAILLVFLLGLNWGFLETFLFVLLDDLNSTHYLMGLSAFMANLLSIPVVFVGDSVVRHLGHHIIFIIAFFGYFFREFVYSFVTEPWVVVGLECAKVMSYALPWVAIMKLCPVLAPKGLVATLTGVLSPTHHTFGLAAGSFLGGHLVDELGMGAAFRVFSYISVSCMVLYLALYLLYIRRRHGVLSQEEEQGDERQEEEKQTMIPHTPSAVTHVSTATANTHDSTPDTHDSSTPAANAHASTPDTHASIPAAD